MAWGLAAYIIVEVVLGAAKKTPLWLMRQFLERIRRFFWGELRYLHALTRDPNLRRWGSQYVILQAIKASANKGAVKPSPLVHLLQSYISRNEQVVVLGEPGAGKTTTLEAITYRLARRAYLGRIAVWCGFFVLVALLVTLHSVWWLLLLCSILGFDFIFRRWPLPVLVQLRLYESGPVDDFLKKAVAGRVGGQALSVALRDYVEHGHLVWLLDGVNEVRGGAYESALDGWRECFQPGHYFANAPVIFTSRAGDNPAGRLGLGDVLNVLNLDDEGVRSFLRAYGSQDVAADYGALERNSMLGEQGLSRNPYWLKMTVESGFYIRNRGALFENFARRLIRRELDKFPVRPQPSVVPADDEMEALGDLAFMMSDTNQVGLALDEAEAKLARWLGRNQMEWSPKQVLNQAEAATLMRLSRRGNRAEFSHQLVQEFFAAYALRSRHEGALGHADDHRWWQTLLMLGGLLEEHTIEGGEEVGSHDDYRALVRAVLREGKKEQRPFLAVGLLRSVDQSDGELEREVTAALLESIREGVTPEHKRAAVELARIAPDDVVEAVGVLLGESDGAVKKAAIEILGEVRNAKALTVLVNSLWDETASALLYHELVSIGEGAVEPLIRVFRGQNKLMRPAVVEVLQGIGGPAVAPLVAATEDEDSSVRWRAAVALGDIGDARAVEGLVRLLEGDDALVRSAAAEALTKIGGPSVAPLIRVLKDSDANVRWRAAEALGDIRDARAVEPLVQVLKDSDADVRLRAAQALKKIGGAAVEPLVRALGDEDGNLRWRAAETLGSLRDERAIGPLVRALADEDKDVRRVAAKALAYVGDERAVKPLVHMLKDADTELRWRAAQVLKTLGGAAVEPLMPALGDDDPDVRWRAAEALGSIADARAVAPLVKALADPESEVRWRAAEALGGIGDASAGEALIAATADFDSHVRWRAVQALEKLGGATLEQLLRVLGHWDSHVRMRAADLLGELNDARGVGPLVGALSDADADVRLRAAEALKKMGGAAVEPLARALGDADAGVRWRAAEVLGSIADARAAAPLIEALADTNAEVRRRAAEALGEVGDPAGAAPLIRAMGDDDGEVRWRAAKALKTLGGVGWKWADEAGEIQLPLAREMVLEALISALDDENAHVRSMAADLLGDFRSERAIDPLIEALGSEDEELRRRASAALPKLGVKVVESLIRALRDENRLVRSEAVEVLKKLKFQAIDPLIAALEDTDSRARLVAANALGIVASSLQEDLPNSVNEIPPEFSFTSRLANETSSTRRVSLPSALQLESEKILIERAAEALVRALEDEDGGVRWVAAKMLGSVRSDAAVAPLIIRALGDESNEVRLAAANSLGRCGSGNEVVVKALVVALKDEDSRVRWIAAEALGKSISKEHPAVESLIQALGDENNDVRRMVARTLGFLRDARAVEPLIKALDDENKMVQWEAEKALRSINDPRAKPHLEPLARERANQQASTPEEKPPEE